MKDLALEPLSRFDVEEAVGLVRAAMNDDEAEYAGETMAFHFGCRASSIGDGREYFVWRFEGRIRAVTGLHHYHWGPKENVWLAWFAVHPEFQSKGIGTALLAEMEEAARRKGYGKLFVETYEHPDFARAMMFYQSRGFAKAGRVGQYLPDGSDMVVFVKELGKS